MEIAPSAEVEVLPLIFLTTRTETPSEVGLLVTVSNASFGGRCTGSRSSYQPNDGKHKTQHAFHQNPPLDEGRFMTALFAKCRRSKRGN